MGPNPKSWRRHWMDSAKEWALIAEQIPNKRDKQFAERECWNAVFKAITGL